jgi:heptosyltransferase-1
VAVRVVLVRLSSLGDIVHTWPLAVALRAAQPDMHLTWVVEGPFLPLVENHPAVDCVLTVTTRRWRKRPLAARTRAEIAVLRGRFSELAPDLAIDSQGVLKSALITRWTGARTRIGLRRPWRREVLAGLAYTETLAGSTSNPHVVATNLELGRAMGAKPPDNPVAPDGRWLISCFSDRQPPPVGTGEYGILQPGAGRERKQLPAAMLAGVADRVAALTGRVLVVWGPGEEKRARQIANLADSRVVTAPPTDLAELTLLLSGARLVVGADTGPVHLAASLGVPTVAVFSATDWRRNGPLGPAVAVVSGAEQKNRGPRASAWATPVRTVTVDEVADAAAQLLDRTPS